MHMTKTFYIIIRTFFKVVFIFIVIPTSIFKYLVQFGIFEEIQI